MQTRVIKGVSVGLSVAICLWSSSCDRKRVSGTDGPESHNASSPTQSIREQSDLGRTRDESKAARLKRLVLAAQAFSPELNADLREEFAVVLSDHSGNADEAVEAWIMSYMDAVDPAKFESTAYQLLRAISLQAFGAGGRYIESHFKSVTSRRQALANWFDIGARFKHAELASLFRTIKDPADAELCARRIGGTAQTQSEQTLSTSIAWLKQQVGEEYFGDALNAYLDNGDVKMYAVGDRKALVEILESSLEISEVAKDAVIGILLKNPEASDLDSGVNLLQRLGVKSDKSWVELVSNSSPTDLGGLSQLRDVVPETCTDARRAIAGKVVANNGVTAQSLAFLASGRDVESGEVLPFALHIVKTGTFAESAELVADLSNPEARGLLAWEVVEQGLLFGGKDLKVLEPFTSLVNDPARINLLLRQAEAMRKLNSDPPTP